MTDKDRDTEAQMQPIDVVDLVVEEDNDSHVDDGARKKSKRDKDEGNDTDLDQDIDLDVNSKAKKRKRDEKVDEKQSSSPPLKKAKTGKRKKRKAEADTYVVERILGWRNNIGTIEYQVAWQGYTAEYNTWEPLENLTENSKFQSFIEEIMLGCITNDASELVDHIRKKSPETLKEKLMEKYHFGDSFDKAALRTLLQCAPKADKQIQ